MRRDIDPARADDVVMGCFTQAGEQPMHARSPIVSTEERASRRDPGDFPRGQAIRLSIGTLRAIEARGGMKHGL